MDVGDPRLPELWKACAYIYGGEEVAVRVPKLQARVATTCKRKTANAAKKTKPAGLAQDLAAD